MFGSVGAWFFEDVGGIRPDDTAVGFDRIIVRPCIVGDLSHAEARYNSIRGLVACQWNVNADRLKMDVAVPPNVTATVYVPTRNRSSITEGGLSAADARGVQRTTHAEWGRRLQDRWRTVSV